MPHEANLSPVLQGDRGFSFGHPQLRQAQASRAGAKGDDDYDVIGSDGLVIGRIFKATKSPVGTPLMWTLAYGDHEDRTPRGTDMRQHGRPLCRRSLGAGTLSLVLLPWRSIGDRSWRRSRLSGDGGTEHR